jgi:hypothetical protein
MIQEPLPAWIVDQSRAVQATAGAHPSLPPITFFELNDQRSLTASAGLSNLPNHCLINGLRADFTHSAIELISAQSICRVKAS